ncbi:uncharacterized protein PV07_11746 [Cladophialophora immunda]|uniref:N-acetyltransferase domain-containing protein n=1 Tax=Cladophialophora immunda TaxID=569365 RepID=A0A0D2AFB3_9EURO|nr:uncharacterized protein PV07_11746 [Cladophialophora immunda]KIW23557.1 hypothetical protein PV07_11746 [Cladophialophora immunda]
MAYQKQSISPVSSSDLPFLSDLVHTCKLALPINRLLFKDWPNDAAQKPLYAAAVESAFKGESVDCLKSVDQQPGDILGYLALTRKRPHTGSTETQPPSGKGIGSEKQQDIPEFFNSEVLSAVSNAVSEIAKGTEGFDHFELSYICVKPSARRHGIGSQLVNVCLERARTEGIPLVVCSEPAAHEFFLNLGFRDTTHVDIDLTKWAPTHSGFGNFRLSGMFWTP